MLRRTLLLAAPAGLPALLGGCGFRPLYAPDSAAGTGTATDLAAVYVTLIPERTGQLLRQALQRRLEGSDPSRPKRYELTATATIVGEGIAIQSDNSASRLRFVGTSNWTLRDLTPQRAVVASGTARSLDGLNILNQQYFAADLETETIYRRLAEALAGQIVQQVAVYMRKQRDAQAT